MDHSASSCRRVRVVDTAMNEAVEAGVGSWVKLLMCSILYCAGAGADIRKVRLWWTVVEDLDR